jgi:lincosamide and streptogramin A transport system ATP-binding/permease protein
MSIIRVSNLTFGYDSSYENVFEDVSFQIDTDWKLGFVGRNGRGKTTFLNLLLGELQYSGNITSSVGFSYFPFTVSDSSLNTLDIIDLMNPNYEFWELCREMNLLDVSEDVLFRPFETLSYGERTKTLIAALFLRPDTFLLLDEPTNHLDMRGKEKLAKYLALKKGFILVSHDRALLDAVTDHTLSINKTNIEVINGGFSTWYTDKEMRDRSEREENKKLQKDIHRLKEATKRTANWSDKVEATKIGQGPVDRGNIGHKAAKMMKRAKNIESRQNQAIDQKSALLKNIETVGNLKLAPLKYHSAVLAEFNDVSVLYGDNTVVENVNFIVKEEDRIAIIGGNGSGKSSLIKLLVDCPQNTSFGMEPTSFCAKSQNPHDTMDPATPLRSAQDDILMHTGIVKLGSNVKISYVPQDTSHLRGDIITYAKNAGIDQTLFRAILINLGFERAQFDSDLSALSEGQKKKILIARSLSESAHLYIWDEPLNYIDIQSRMQIEALILEYKPTMIFVEHDSIFVEKIATMELKL